MKTKTIHHISKDLSHEVIETQTFFLGFMIKRSLITKQIQ